MPASIRTPEKEIAFLAALAATANVARACEAAGIGRTTAYEWRWDDEEFCKRWDKAAEIGAEALEDEAVRRAHEACTNPLRLKLTSPILCQLTPRSRCNAVFSGCPLMRAEKILIVT
jgi:hypothetical protein